MTIKERKRLQKWYWWRLIHPFKRYYWREEWKEILGRILFDNDNFFNAQWRK